MICAIMSNGDELSLKNKNEKDKPYPLIKLQIRNVIWELYCNGYDEFYLNCEYGVQLWSAEIICAFKLYNSIKLHILIPYEEQAVNWCEEYRDRYYKVHLNADNVCLINTHYHYKCYAEVDEIMISKSDLLLVFGEKNNKSYFSEHIVKNNVQMIYYKLDFD